MKQLFDSKRRRKGLFLLFLALSFMAPAAMAGAGGAEFAAIQTLLLGWSQGNLGKIIAMSIFLVGISAGILNQSIGAIVIGIGGALALFYGPTVINGIVSAVI